MSAAPPTLADVLALDDDHARDELLARPHRYLSQAQVAEVPAKARLVALLAPLWPSDGLRAHMSVENGKWTLDSQVYAMLVLGPAIDLPLNPERWAEIACSGFVFSEQADWLRRQYISESAAAAARCEADDVRTWEQILTGIPDEEPIPDELVAALVTRMRTLAREDDFLFLPYIGRRLARAGRLDALAELIEVNESFADNLAPSLAAGGNVESAAALLDSLAVSLGAGLSADHLDLEWLAGVHDPSLLPHLFVCMRASLAIGQDGPLGALPSLISTIRRIGGEETVARYDELMASSAEPRFRFMRASREEVVQDELNKAGERAAPAAAASLGFPVFPPRG